MRASVALRRSFRLLQGYRWRAVGLVVTLCLLIGLGGIVGALVLVISSVGFTGAVLAVAVANASHHPVFGAHRRALLRRSEQEHAGERGGSPQRQPHLRLTTDRATARGADEQTDESLGDLTAKARQLVGWPGPSWHLGRFGEASDCLRRGSRRSRCQPSKSERCFTTAPARTTQPAPITLWSQTIAPGSMTDPAPMRQPWIMAPGPTITPSSMTRSLSGSRCSTVFSRICTSLPMRTGPWESPMILTPAPMIVRSPTTTSPVISAVGNSTADAATVRHDAAVVVELAHGAGLQCACRR